MNGFQIGVYGLGIMGSGISKNFISRGISSVLYSQNEEERNRFQAEGTYQIVDTEKELVSQLQSPRIIFMMVTAGEAVDMVISALLPHLEKGDVLIDGGNSDFRDTQRRCVSLEEKGIDFLGVGVSGGEQGAMYGPSMMVGGSASAFAKSESLLQAVAAKYKDVPMCQYLGKEGSGHYVKMVHNGIEYAMMQVIADAYTYLNDILKLSHDEIIETFKSYQNSEISSYLVDITVDILLTYEGDTPLIYKILDVAKQKGTGSLVVEEGLRLGVSIPSITDAVFLRYFSAEKQLRERASTVFAQSMATVTCDGYRDQLQHAIYLGFLICYSQGIQLIEKASAQYNWQINMTNAVAVWQEGCIIRSDMIVQILEALENSENSECLLLSPTFTTVNAYSKDLRELCALVLQSGVAMPVFMGLITYFDTLRTEYMNMNMIQALRDYFGAHTYERVDQDGAFHTNWNNG